VNANHLKETEEPPVIHLKLLYALMIAVVIALPAGITVAQDEENEPKAKDTPYFSGMPNYKITDSYDQEFADYRFFNGKDCNTAEGKKSHRAYTLKEDAQPASELQISRNYANAVKEMGGTVVFEGLCEGADCAENCGYRMMVGKVVEGDNELWVEVVPFNDGNDYYITLIAKESMKQDVTASGMLDALNRDGRVALYINFDFGKATIRPDSKPIIDQIVQMMKASQGLELSIEGHTDNVGDSASNIILSQSRSKEVAATIVAQGIDTKRLSTLGHGEDKPIASNDSEDGRAKNRRVELVKRSKAPSGSTGPSQAPEHFGIKVYPGAQFDAEQTTSARQVLGSEVFCYRTKDEFKKVVAYYENHGGLVSLGTMFGSEKNAVYGKDESGSGVRISIESPWTDPKTGESRTDTMIQILKAE
jgi:OmpA-OmpF porin, OOP family